MKLSFENDVIQLRKLNDAIDAAMEQGAYSVLPGLHKELEAFTQAVVERESVNMLAFEERDIRVEEALAIAKNIAETIEYDYLGIRWQEPEYKLGDIAHCSHVLVDGDDTEEELDGVCVWDDTSGYDREWTAPRWD